MIRKTLTALSAGLFVALAGFGLSQGASGKATSGDPFEEQVITSLHLTQKQTIDYRDAKVWMDDETQLMYKMPHDEMIKRGNDLNKIWRSKLQAIFTSAQWSAYCKAWEPMSPGKPQTAHGAVNMDWGSSETQIRATLHLSEKQKKELSELDNQLKIENAKLRELWDGSDSDAIGVQSSKINRLVNDGMKRILTSEQLASWKKQWEALMAPLLENGKNSHGLMKPIPKGKNQVPPPMP